ncbi:MAG: VOC family protein [Rubrivivax sp.]|nr:VOC family protein [Rubrivivax sp.]
MSVPFRYRKLGYAALSVTNLERSLHFYRDLLGLELVEQRDDVAYLRCSRDHHNIALHAGQTAGLKRVGWELESQADVERAIAHFEGLGLAPRRVDKAESQALRQGPGFRVRLPGAGLEFDYYGSTTVMARPWTPTVARIARLGHVVIGCADFAAAQGALLRDFGFVQSDFVEDRFSFMRCFPNPFHHTFAVGASAGNHLHHVNFMVTDIDDVGRAWHRMTKAGVKIAFGIGRHPPSGSVFLYFYDPDGMTVEYSYGMEEFPEVGAREPRMLEPVPESLDTWGAVPDVNFGKVGAIEAA